MDMGIALSDAFPHLSGDLLLRFGGQVTIDLILVHGQLIAA